MADRDAMAEALADEVAGWLPEGTEVLWKDTYRFQDGFVQQNVLAVDRDQGEVTILRGWTSPNGKPSVSVDLRVPYDVFAGPVTEDVFPHAGSRAGEGLEPVFRAHLLGEHVEIVWQCNDGEHASFVARSAKVGRDEQVIAGSATVKDGAADASIDFRQELVTLRPEQRRAMAR